jgi:hypothetical protein
MLQSSIWLLNNKREQSSLLLFSIEKMWVKYYFSPTLSDFKA